MAYPFAAAEVLTAVDLNAMIGAPTQNTQTGTTYTAVLLDAGKTVTLSNASAVTLTIPAQASVSWADNTQLNFLNIGAGTVTITAAAGVTINGTPLTLTTSKGGSLVRTASNTWTFTPSGGGGKVLQVVQGTTSTRVDTTSTSFVTTGLTATITPSSATSKILIVLSGTGRNSNATHPAYFTLFRGTTAGTNLGAANGMSSVYSGAGTIYVAVNIVALDEPATTSAQAYTLGMRANNAAATVSLCISTEKANIILIEVAA